MKGTAMHTDDTKRPDTSDREIINTRIFHAPREMVFDAWTDPAQVDQWMGPRGFTTKTISMDVRPGGTWRYTMTHDEHGVFPNRVRYHEVVRPERLVYTHDAGVDNDPQAFEVTVTFVAQGDKTKLTMHMVLASAAELERVKAFGAIEGGQQTLDRLAEHLAKA
jgi:uncharacterized protein YndB with AHSA1/START domain